MATKKTAKKPSRKKLQDLSRKTKSGSIKGGGIKTMSTTNPGTAGGGGH